MPTWTQWDSVLSGGSASWPKLLHFWIFKKIWKCCFNQSLCTTELLYCFAMHTHVYMVVRQMTSLLHSHPQLKNTFIEVWEHFIATVINEWKVHTKCTTSNTNSLKLVQVSRVWCYKLFILSIVVVFFLESLSISMLKTHEENVQ